MGINENSVVVLDVFDAIERRDQKRIAQLFWFHRRPPTVIPPCMGRPSECSRSGPRSGLR
jgi:hypothetical protein